MSIPSLAWPDPLRTGAYRLEIISAVLQGSGILHKRYLIYLFVCSSVAKCRAFRSLVIPILEYASQVWNPHTQKNICQLEAIQLRAACWVCGSRFNHLTVKWSKSSSQCRSELNWPELSTRRKYLSLLTVHDILHKRIALRFSDYFTFSSLCTQSHSLSLYCRSSTINSFRYSFFIN